MNSLDALRMAATMLCGIFVAMGYCGPAAILALVSLDATIHRAVQIAKELK